MRSFALGHFMCPSYNAECGDYLVVIKEFEACFLYVNTFLGIKQYASHRIIFIGVFY